MKIGNGEYSEIIVTNNRGELLARITDDNIITVKKCNVNCVSERIKLKVDEGAQGFIEEYTDLSELKEDVAKLLDERVVEIEIKKRAPRQRNHVLERLSALNFSEQTEG